MSLCLIHIVLISIFAIYFKHMKTLFFIIAAFLIISCEKQEYEISLEEEFTWSDSIFVWTRNGVYNGQHIYSVVLYSDTTKAKVGELDGYLPVGKLVSDKAYPYSFKKNGLNSKYNEKLFKHKKWILN
jgi:hypothetical protein